MRGSFGPRLNKTARLERNAKIVKLRDEHGLTFKAISQRFGMTCEGVQGVYRKSKRR